MHFTRSDVKEVFQDHSPNAATAAIVLIPAAALQTWIIDAIYWCYSEAPGTANILTVAFTSGSFDIQLDKVAGPRSYQFHRGLTRNVENEACTITLPSGAGTCVGWLGALYH